MNINTIIPIVIFGVISIVVIAIIFILSKRRQPANEIKLMPITHPNDEVNKEEVKEEPKEEPVKVEEVKQEIKEEVKEPVKEEVKKEEQTPLINIPINQMDDTPIEIEEAKTLVEENNEEMVKVVGSTPIEEPKKEPVITEEPISNTEIIESEPIIDTTLIKTVVPSDNEITEVKMIDSAFHQSPNDNRDINTNIKVEDTREYVGARTEILDTEDIKRAMASKE